MADSGMKALAVGVFLLTGLIFGGTYLFSIIEGVDYFNSFYYIFLFVTTIGSPYFPATIYGKLLIIAVVGFGMGLFFYVAIFVATTLIEGQTRLLLGGIAGGLGRMKKDKNHTIVCGYGKLGRYVVEELKMNKQKFVVVEKDQSKVTDLISKGCSVLQGDALNQDVLKKVNIEKAKGLIGTLGEDSDNIYLMLTATELNPNLNLGAKAEEEHAVDRLHKVGAKIVVLPQVVGGRQLTNAFLQLEKSEELETVSKKKK